MLTPQFATIAPIFSSMPAFHILFAIIHHYAGRNDSLGIITCEKGQSRQFSAQLDSVQECSGLQY
jgi:hypothetical protein